MNPIVYHIVSGQAFFSGILLIVLAAFASLSSQSMWKRLSGFLFVISGLLMLISSTPLPYWLYGIASLFTVFWIGSAFLKSWRNWSVLAMSMAWLIAAGCEIPYLLSPSLQSAETRTVTIIGDSVTAGTGADDFSTRWPELLRTQHNLSVQDISHMGDTVATALNRATSHEIASSVIVLEIGGNDLLGSTGVGKFAGNLDLLLARLVAPGRQIVMFELPLPPFYHEFGRIQRTLAAKYQVKLIPKRIFLSVLADSGATLDSIHLSQSGHQQMADSVWNVLKSAFAN